VGGLHLQHKGAKEGESDMNETQDAPDCSTTKYKHATKMCHKNHLVDDASVATGLDGSGLLQNGLGLLDISGGGSGNAVLLGNLLAKINAVVSLVPDFE
jgi:hypothetical protein